MRNWGFVFMVGGFVVALSCPLLVILEIPKSGNLTIPAVMGVFLLIGGSTLAFGRNPFPAVWLGQGIHIGGDSPLVSEKPPQKTLPPAMKQKREEYAKKNPPPRYGAPAFNALTDVPDLSGMPGADPMVPMYLLDKNFHILDWNEAFSLAFDRTMEGRRGQGALEWVYFLDNFEESLEHARQVFSNAEHLPTFDKEELRYTSLTYKQLTATKRAYQFPDDSGGYAGWVIVLDLRFSDSQKAEQYQFDLTSTLSRGMLWSEYALSYDRVLMNSACYQNLLARILGEDGTLEPIADGAKVLDLGAGTGNITTRLAQCGRLVFAMDNSRSMLRILRSKCQNQNILLRRDDSGPGVIIIKQDVNSLFGMNDDYFDYVIANNALYSIDDPADSFEQISRVVRPGGEVRVSGPTKGFSLDKVFRRIKADLILAGKFNEMKPYYEQAMRINYMLEPVLRRWSELDVEHLLTNAAFEIVGQETYYGGNGQILAARKQG